jgi:predicted nucleotidyltransferase
MKDDFLSQVSERLAALPGVVAVALGGSRATGTEREDSDWDLAVYYRTGFDPADLRAIGWPGEVSEIGGWGGGVFNGGAWLTIDGRRVDVHYRDLSVVEREWREAAVGRFRVEDLLFHLAGIPSYLVVGELALNRVLVGRLPRPDYPEALRRSAASVWRERARLTLGYARDAYVRDGRLTQCVGLLAQACLEAAHGILASRGEWPTNEKRLLERADLSDVDRLLSGVTAERLGEVVDAVAARLGVEPGPVATGAQRRT